MSPYEKERVSLKDLKEGDQIAFNRGPYDHHGIATKISGEGCTFVEFGPREGGISSASSSQSFGSGVKGIIKESTIRSDQIRNLFRVISPTSYSATEIVERARSRLGEGKYNLLLNNCESFANWCRTGLKKSYQVAEFGEEVLRSVGDLVFNNRVCNSRVHISTTFGVAVGYWLGSKIGGCFGERGACIGGVVGSIVGFGIDLAIRWFCRRK